MVRVLAFALAFALALVVLAPASDAQLPATPLDPFIKQVQRNATGGSEAILGPQLTKEDVDVRLDMQFRDVDFDTLNVIFGGGKFAASARIEARIDLRVIAAARVQQALEGIVPGSSNVTAAANVKNSFIPADVFRTTFAGEALAAFQGEQEKRLADYIRDTIPNVTVLNTKFEWSNVSPEDSIEGPVPPGQPPQEVASINDPTFPPITLRATVDVQYLERTSLIHIVEKALAKPKSAREKQHERDVADVAAAYDRSAFGLLGIRQVLDLQAPEGWNLVVHVQLPEGFTFEEASPDVSLARDLREADVLTLGKDAETAVLNPVALTLSNRFIVSSAMLGAVLLTGAILRFPVLIATNAIRRRLRR